MDTVSTKLQQSPGLTNDDCLTGKRLLFIGHSENRRNVWQRAAWLGLQCYVIGAALDESMKEKVTRYIRYNTNDHTDDAKHCDAIVDLVKSEIGDVDGCLTLYDDCVSLTALICDRLQLPGIPFASAEAAVQKWATFEALGASDTARAQRGQKARSPISENARARNGENAGARNSKNVGARNGENAGARIRENTGARNRANCILRRAKEESKDSDLEQEPVVTDIDKEERAQVNGNGQEDTVYGNDIDKEGLAFDKEGVAHANGSEQDGIGTENWAVVPDTEGVAHFNDTHEEVAAPVDQEEGVVVHDEEGVVVHDTESGVVHDEEGWVVHDMEGVAVHDEEGVVVHDEEGGMVHDMEGVAVHDEDGVAVHDEEGVAVHDEEGVAVHDEEGVAVHDKEGVVVHDEEGVAVHDEEGVAVHDEEGVAVHDEEGVAVHDEEGVAVHDEEGVAVHDEEGVAVHDEEGVAVHDEEGVVVHDEEGVAVHDEEGVAVHDEEGVAVHDEEGVAQYTSRCWRVSSSEDVARASRAVGFPAVLKRESGSCSLSVRMVRDADEAQAHLARLKRLSASRDPSDTASVVAGTALSNSRCVLMQFLVGTEHCVDLAAFHGELIVAAVTDKGPYVPPDTFHTVTVLPSLLDGRRRRDVVRAAWRCCRALGLRHGVFNVDVMMTSSGPKLIEINPRMAGFNQPVFLRTVYGLDLFRLTCMLACDLRPTFLCDVTAPEEGGVKAESDVVLASGGKQVDRCILNGYRRSGKEGTNHAKAYGQEPTSHAKFFGQEPASHHNAIGQKVNNHTNVFGQELNNHERAFRQETASHGQAFDTVFGQELRSHAQAFGQEANNADKADNASGQEPASASALSSLTAACCMVGLTLYRGRHGAALRTSAQPWRLQALQDAGRLLYIPTGVQLEGCPFCSIAVRGETFAAARRALEDLCGELGIEAPELSASHYNA